LVGRKLTKVLRKQYCPISVVPPRHTVKTMVVIVSGFQQIYGTTNVKIHPHPKFKTKVFVVLTAIQALTILVHATVIKLYPPFLIVCAVATIVDPQNREGSKI